MRLGKSSRRAPWMVRGLLSALTIAALVGATPSSTLGATSAPDKDPEKQLAALSKRAAALEKDYRGRIEILRDLNESAARATADAARRNGELDAARVQIRGLVAGSYMSGGPASMPVVLNSDGSSLREAVALEYLARNSDRRVRDIATLAVAAQKSRRAAQSKIDSVRREIAALEGKRGKVRRLLAKYKAESAKAGRPDGVGGKTKSPLVGNYMTPRMRKVLLEIDGKFGPFPTIGCYRAGDPQDHGSGRACDFMESTAGRMPSASATAHGDSVAKYVVANASRLGIKYIIWRQRIWDSRSGSGWRQMENRGGITQNHMDHPHVSVL
ncbi:hypothetical protein [Actinomadura sp. 6N118]|uniref:hypothetical protein n=1 Tax=Actinomadura sp. 6N118 TaxID=3375151 RepID=UPI0037B9ACCE